MNLLCNIVKAYSSSVQEEKQWNMGCTWDMKALAMVVWREEPVALVAQHGQSSSRSKSSNQNTLHYSYCDQEHHVQHVESWMGIH